MNEKVNPKKFTYEIILSKGFGKLTRNAEKMIYDLGVNAIRKKAPENEDLKKDSLQTSFFNMLSNWQSFNPDKTTNAFAYFTELHKRSIAEAFNTWHSKKGLKKDERNSITCISINSSNNGKGLYNF